MIYELIRLANMLDQNGLFNEANVVDTLIKKEAENGKKKDKCYHKVKSRYKKWPSAYGSGALVKCREVGAENWGEGGSKKKNKTKKKKKSKSK